MNELVNFYQQHALPVTNAPNWLASLRTQACADFKRLGLPNVRDEAWKYTDISRILTQNFVKSSEPPRLAELSDKAVSNFSLPHHVIVSNGACYYNPTQKIPQGIIITSLADALNHHEDKIRPRLAQLLQHQHGLQALNTAAWQNGIFIYVPENVVVTEPLVIVNWQDIDNQAIYLRNLIVVENNSKASVINYFHGACECSYLTNVVTEAYLAQAASLTYYDCQCESTAALHVAHLAVKQAQDSQFSSHSLHLGAKLARSDIDIYLSETQARASMNGIYIPAEHQHIDHHTVVHHLSPDCASVQDYKGILLGNAKAVFNGQIKVAIDAQRTHAQQQNKNLLLSPKAHINTKPQLEIYADDVICTHGATVGQLDEEALFYLMTRGLTHSESIRYLIEAFAADNLRLIADADIAAWMANAINKQWGNNEY